MEKVKMKTYLPMEALTHAHLYRLSSRNLPVGVWDEIRKGFIGAREKFGNTTLDIEYHYDIGAPLGTAFPYRDLGPALFHTNTAATIEWLQKKATACFAWEEKE